MKKVIFILMVLAAVSFIFLLKKDVSMSSYPAVKSETSENKSITVEGNTYYYDAQRIDNIDKLLLRPNFSDKKTSREIFKNENCSFLINGGFYSKANRPLGLFLYDEKRISEKINSKLLNAFLSINDFSTPRITKDLPADNLEIVLQTGPMLIENGQVLTISSNNEKARRMVAAVNGENSLYFLTFYLEDGFYEGPALSELPKLVDAVAKVVDTQFADAVNLDGGSASAYISSNISLYEISPIGSYFCLQN